MIYGKCMLILILHTDVPTCSWEQLIKDQSILYRSGIKVLCLGFVFSTCKYTSVFLNFMEHMKGIFNWNVKQLFLYLTAEYSTKNNVCVFLPLFQIV